MEFFHRVDRIAEVFESVVRPEHANLTVAKRPALVEVGGDPSAVQIDRLVTGGRVDPAADIDLPQAVEITPFANPGELSPGFCISTAGTTTPERPARRLPEAS
jgi:hypothetical protein